MSTSEETKSLSVVSPKVKLSIGQQMAEKPLEDLAAIVATKRDALEALKDHPSMSARLKAATEAIASLANPQRPGMEETNTYWKVARVNIAQPTTQSDMKPEAAKQGDLYTTSGQLLQRPFGIIPIYFHEENINFPQNGKIPVCQSMDAKLGSPFGECLKCPHLPLGKQPGKFEDQKKTDCTNNIVCVAMTVDLSMVCVIQFAKTSRKAGNALLSLAGQQQFVWKQSYLLDTERASADVGVYYKYKMSPTGKDNDADVQLLARGLYELYVAERNRGLHMHYNRVASAPQVAAESEASFAAGALDVGLGEEPDLSTPSAPATTTTTPPATPAPDKTSGKARSSNKPM